MLLGSYGQTNLGDDLLLRNYLEHFVTLGCSEIDVSVSRADLIPDSIRRAFPQARCFELYRIPPLKLVRMLMGVDAVVYGGGSVFKELYSSTSRGRYGVITRVMMFNALARLLRRPIYNLNISIGHIGTRAGRWITRLGLALANRTLMRDGHSHAYAVRDLGLSPAKVVSSTDGLFLSRHWQEERLPSPVDGEPSRRCADPGGSRMIGVNLVSDIPDWVDRDAYLEAANHFLAGLLERGDELVLMPFQHDFTPGNDLAFMSASVDPGVLAHPRCRLLERVTIDDVKARFAELDAFVGMRFHSLLLAAVTGTPFVGVSYDVKCTQFLAESAYDHWVELDGMTSAAVLTALDRLTGDSAAATSALSAAVAPRFTQAQDDLARAIPAFAPLAARPCRASSADADRRVVAPVG